MKKGIIVLLITVLTAGMVFADVTGSASFSAGFDLDDKVFTIDNSKTGSSTFKFDFAAESNETAAVESGIYAKLGGSFEAYMTEGDLKVDFKLSDATIQAVDGLWSVNLTKVANGVELTYAGNSLDVYYTNKLNWGASLTSKDFTIMDGLTISGKVGYTVARNDLTDPANYTYGFDSDTQGKIAEAMDTEAYFKKHADGTYYNANLAKFQGYVATAETALKEAKEAFAKEPTVANYANIADCEDDLAYYEWLLSYCEGEYLTAFKKANSGDKKWYTANTSYTYKKAWEVNNAQKTTTDSKKILQTVELPKTDEDVTYVILKDSDNELVAVKIDEYKPGSTEETRTYVTTVTGGSNGYIYAQQYEQNKETITYVDNEALYAFEADAGKATVDGGVKIAYSVDKINASLEANVAYETIAKKPSYDFTLKGGYDFVSASAKFDSDKVLDASVKVVLDSVVGLPLTVSGGATDILSKGDAKRAYNGEVAVTVAGVSVKANGTFKTVADTGYGKWSAGLEVGYSMDVASFKFTGTMMKEAGIDSETHEYAAAKLAVLPTLEVSSTALINNATLGLKWAGAQFGGNPKNASLGAVTATIGIEF